MDLHEWFDAKHQLLQGKRDKWVGLHEDMARRLHVKRVGVVPGWIHQHYAHFMQHLNLQDKQKVSICIQFGLRDKILAAHKTQDACKAFCIQFGLPDRILTRHKTQVVHTLLRCQNFFPFLPVLCEQVFLD